MKNYLPEGFENLQTQRSYVNLSKLPEGEYKFRIVQRPIAGWIDWKDKKPYRFRPSQKPAKAFDDTKPIKAFWSCYVWDYLQEDLFVMEITQTGILKSLTTLAKDEDWGDFTGYDIKIKKTGAGKETEYQVNPVPHKPLTDAMTARMAIKPANLDALYEGGDPWKKADPSEKNDLQTLTEVLELDGIDTSYLWPYLMDLSEKKGHPIDQIVESALLPQLLPKFKASYVKELSKHLPAEAAI